MIKRETILETIQFHKRRGAPLLAVNSPDPITLAREIPKEFEAVPVLLWDVVVGFELGHGSQSYLPTPAATEAWSAVKETVTSLPDGARKDSLDNTIRQRGKVAPQNALDLAHEMPANTILVVKHANDLLRNHATQQAIMNLRNVYAGTNRTLILLDNDIVVPECLRNDFIILDDNLPEPNDYADSIGKICRSVNVATPEDIQPVIDAIAGLPLFQAEQALSLAIQADGYDMPKLWSLKKQLVDQTHGLSVHYQGDGFAKVGGLHGIKSYFSRLMRGPKPPQILVWLDEIEKSGLAHTGDTNGINADALGSLLSYIEDHNSYCVSLTGLPGTGKSLIAKSVGVEFNRLVIRMDLGAMKGSYVGESESRLRAALRLISALSNDNALFIATSNTTDSLDAALRSRFVDTFYFPLPTREELSPVWEIHKAKYEFIEGNPDDTSWVSRNVKQCVEKAYRMGMTLADTSKSIIPLGVSMAKEVEKLNDQARGRFLCASTGEQYE